MKSLPRARLYGRELILKTVLQDRYYPCYTDDGKGRLIKSERLARELAASMRQD